MIDEFLTVPEKIYYKLFVKFNGINKCFYKQKRLDRSKRVILYLDYPQFIHLGDTLWCEPVAGLLDANFEMAICCHSPMEFYFRRLGYKVVNKSSIDHDDVLVARTELAYHLRGKNVLWINFNYINVSEPIINAVLNNIADWLDLKVNNAKPRALSFSPAEIKSVALKFGIKPTCMYAVFNNYIDSHKVGMSKSVLQKTNKALRLFAERYRENSGVKLIHTGTKKEKKRDSISRGVADLDLRGETSIEESFILASMDNVITYVGFDAFWLHLFNIYNKNSYIVLRPGFSGKWKNQVKNYVATPYITEESRVTFIDDAY